MHVAYGILARLFVYSTEKYPLCITILVGILTQILFVAIGTKGNRTNLQMYVTRRKAQLICSFFSIEMTQFILL